MNGHSGRPLVTPRQIVTDPGDIPRERGVDAYHGNEDTSIDDARDTSASRCEDNGEADSDHSHEEEDEGGSLAMAVRVIGTDDGDGGRSDIDGDGQELCSRCRVAKIFDDGWQEETDAV